MKWIISASLLLTQIALGTAQQSQKQRVDGFRIDPQKPYVYLQVVSIGARKAIEVGESKMGIKLRLVNNSHLPISIVTFASDEERAKGEYKVMDEIIPDPWIGTGEESGTGATSVQQDQKGLTDVIRWPNQTEREIKAAETSANSVRPHGYSDQYSLGRKYLTVIRPGEAASFSYPAGHISEAWHLEIPFRLALESDGTSRPPYSHVALYWSDLSESDRSKLREASVAKSK
jgi:hypothetical protein